MTLSSRPGIRKSTQPGPMIVIRLLGPRCPHYPPRRVCLTIGSPLRMGGGTRTSTKSTTCPTISKRWSASNFSTRSGRSCSAAACTWRRCRKSMTHALDVGCGTGNWTMEFAAHHPGVEVIGTDLSPIQPEYVPANCTFYLDDATRAWAFHHRFDYVHTRMLTFGIADWDAFVDQAYTHLQPGGFLELQEWRMPFLSPDDSLRPAHALARWTGLLDTACALLGLDARSSAGHAERMRRRGFEDVVERRLGMSIGPWALGERQKRIGRMGRCNLLEGLDGMSRRLFRVSGVMNDEAEIDTFLREVRQDILNSSIHTMMPLDVIVGQRPFDN